MKIGNEEINLKITPLAIQKLEEIDKDFDILKILREAGQKEPRLSDYYKLIYAGYIGATKKQIDYNEFLNLLEGIENSEIVNTGIDLLIKRKN